MMLQGRASREGYALFLLNLLPAYRALEAALELGRADPCLARLAVRALYRTAAIERDLHVLIGVRDRWPALLPAGAAYGAQVARSADRRLIAHAYVRYLGDLNGGRILARLLARAPGLESEALGFYDYPKSRMAIYSNRPIAPPSTPRSCRPKRKRRSWTSPARRSS
jgi:heme oxygenase (biliverdin-producing, ferredoxin)